MNNIKENTKKLKPSIPFRIFRAYIKFFHNICFYRKVYILNKENVPPNGTPMMIVSNHQNCMCDPLGIVFSFRKRKAEFIARADIFKRPSAAKFLRFVGLLPAFRLDFDGEAALGNNSETFEAAGNELLRGRTVIIYPEAGHQDKRWLGIFSLGYARLAFEAAEKDDFRTDILLLPACNHYSHYFSMQEDLLIKYGTPISLAPYYELYKTKPRTAQREVNKLVWKQISDMMLNITDLENYEAIDYLRNTYGKRYACEKGYNPKCLPEKLLADKELVKELDELKEKDELSVRNLYKETLELKKDTLKNKIRDWNFDKKFSLLSVVGRGWLFVLLFPLFLFSLIPNIIIFFSPRLIHRRITDVMFYNTFNLGLAVLVTIPILYPLSFALCWIITNSFWIALIYLVTLPFLGLFAWYYRKFFIKWRSEVTFNRLKKSEKMQGLIQKRTELFSFLDDELINKIKVKLVG